MTMTYTQLTDRIQTTTENTFTVDELKMFTENAEQDIYNSVSFPALRKKATIPTVADNQFLTLPVDFLYSNSLAVIDATGAFSYALPKDVNFIREAYPTVAASGMPKHYSYFDATTLILGPTPDIIYSIELQYGFYPASIVTAGTTWLGDNFDTALLNGALVEAARFMKSEDDIISVYDKHYMQSLTLLKNLGDGKLRQDSYRDGQLHVKVS